jgi:hypothetical protein
VDVDGAKALTERLARSRAASPQPAAGEIPEGAPPVYRWFAFGRDADSAASATSDGASAENGPTLGQDGLDLPSTSE